MSNVNITRSGDYISATYTSSLVLDWTNGDETWTSGMTDGWYLAGTTTAYGFQNNDNVRFSSATPQSVAVAGSGVTVAEMSVTGDYTFSGGAVNASALSLDNATLRTGTGGSIRSTSTTVSGTSTISASALSAGVLTVNSGASMVLADGITVESTGLVSSGEAPIANWNNLFSGVSGAGTLKFTTLQKIQPGTGNQTWDASLGSNVQSAPKVQNIVFDKGLYIFGNGQKNVDVNQIMSLYDGANVTVNTDALAIMRVKLLVDGGSVTATNGITIGHTENSNGYRGIVELKSGSISTTNIASVNQSDESAFIMSGGELSLSGSSLFELAVNNSRLQVSLTGGTIQAGADANLVALNGNAADKINFIIGGTQDNPFTIDTQGHSVTLNHDYEQTGTIYAGGNGTLVLDSTINMAHMDDLECSTVHTIGSYTDITNTGNGYLAASYLLVRNTGDATIELGANASFTCSGQEAQIMLLEDDNGTTHAYVSTNSTGGDYYINQGTTTYDAAGNWAYSANTTGLVLNGGDLILNKDLRLDKNDNLVDIYVAQNAKVTVEEGVTLARSNMTFAEGKQVTLAGRGLVDIGTYRDVDFSGLVTTDPAWNGALLIHGKHNTADINFNDIPGLNAMNTTIALMGFTGSGTGNYLAQSNSAFGTNKIMLIGNGEQAFTITNGYSNTIYDIHGLCGTGDFVKKGGHNNFQIRILGDSADWTGSFIVTAGIGTIRLAGDDDITLGSNLEARYAVTNNITTTLSLIAEGSGTKTFSGNIVKVLGANNNAPFVNITTAGTATIVFTKANTFNSATFGSGTGATFADGTSIDTVESNGFTLKDTANLSLTGLLTLKSGQMVLDNSTVTATGGLDGRGARNLTGTLKLQNYSTMTVSGNVWSRSVTMVTVDSTSTFSQNNFAISGVDSTHDAVVTFTDITDNTTTNVNSAGSIVNAAINYTGGNATLSSTLTNSTLTHSGNGTLTLTGNTGSGAVSVTTADSVLKLQHTAATTTANAITYELGGGLQTGTVAETVSGRVLVKDGTLTLSVTGTLTLDDLVTGSTGVVSNEGTTVINSLDLATTLANTGTLTIDAEHLTIDTWGLTHFETTGSGATYADNTLHITTSGFASGSYIIVKSTGSGTLTVTNEEALTDLGLAVQDNNIVYGNAQDLQTYVVNENLTYSTTEAYTKDNVTLRVTDGNTMTIDSTLRTGTKVEVNRGGTLEITADNTLASADAKFDSGSTLKITSGTLTLSDLGSDDQVAVTFGNNGATLALTGDSTIDTTKQTFNFGGNNTHLVIAGTTTLDGTLNITRTSTGNHHLLLRGGNSLTLADGASLTYVNDTFTAKGGGAVGVISSTNAQATDVELSPRQAAQKFENLAITLGGISGENRGINATLTGSDVTAKDANFTFGANVASLTSFDASTAGTVVFNGNISISGTTTTGTHAATFNGTADLTGDATFGGTATFTGAATLGGNASFTGEATFNEAASITGNSTISNGAAFGKAATFGGNVSISGASSFSGKTTFNGTSVTIKAGTKVNANSVNMYLADGSDLTLEAGASLAHDGFTYSVEAGAGQSGTIHKVDNEKSLTGQEATRFSASYSDGATLSNMTVTQSDTDEHINMSFDGVDYVNTGHETRLMGATNNFNTLVLGKEAAGTLYIKSDVYMTGRLTLANAGDVIKMDQDKSLTVSNGKIQLTGRHGITDGSEVVTVTNANSTISGEHTDGVTVKNVNVFIDNEDTENSFTWSAKVDDAESNVTNTGAGTVTMTADSTMATLSANHGNLILTGSNTASGVVVSPSGTLTLAGSGSITTGALTLGKYTPAGRMMFAAEQDGGSGEATAEVTGGTMQNVTANNSAITATDSNMGHGTMDTVHIDLDEAGSVETPYQISQVDMTNTLVDLRNTSCVTMEDVTIGAGTVISTSDDSTLNISNSTLVLTENQLTGSGASATDASKTVGTAFFDLGGASLTDALTLQLTSEFMQRFAEEAGTAKLDTLEIYLVNVSNAQENTGEGAGIFAVGSEWGDNYALTVNNRVYLNDGSGANGVVLCVDVNPAIPEPATGVLGVLALAGLAARRRRKAIDK